MKHSYIEIKTDKRFKDGNIKQTDHELRGNPETLDMHTMLMDNMPPEMQLTPPIVVSNELGEAIKKMETN